MAITHVSEADAVRDLAGLLIKVRAGEHVQIDNEADSFMIVPVRGRWLGQPRPANEVLAGLQEDASTALLDDQFARDVVDGIRSHEHERLIDPWESF